jgi:hypothetical protein
MGNSATSGVWRCQVKIDGLVGVFVLLVLLFPVVRRSNLWCAFFPIECPEQDFLKQQQLPAVELCVLIHHQTSQRLGKGRQRGLRFYERFHQCREVLQTVQFTGQQLGKF